MERGRMVYNKDSCKLAVSGNPEDCHSDYIDQCYYMLGIRDENQQYCENIAGDDEVKTICNALIS